MEGDLAGLLLLGLPDVNFNPLPPHGGRLCQVDAVCSAFHISIHSLRMEGDRVDNFREV